MSEVHIGQSDVDPFETRVQLQREWDELVRTKYSVFTLGGQPTDGVAEYLLALLNFQTEFVNALPHLVELDLVRVTAYRDAVVVPREFFVGDRVGPCMTYGLHQIDDDGSSRPIMSTRVFHLFPLLSSTE